MSFVGSLPPHLSVPINWYKKTLDSMRVDPAPVLRRFRVFFIVASSFLKKKATEKKRIALLDQEFRFRSVACWYLRHNWGAVLAVQTTRRNGSSRTVLKFNFSVGCIIPNNGLDCQYPIFIFLFVMKIELSSPSRSVNFSADYIA